MSEPSDQVTRTQELLDRLRKGDESARTELIEHSMERLRRIARRQRRDSRIQRWVETDDVWNNALLRLHRALAAVKPESARHFHNLAAEQVRRELLDLLRKHFGPQGIGANYVTDKASSDSNQRPMHEAKQTTHDPAKLFDWTLFHEKVEALPEREQEVFNLHWYEGLPLVRIAAMWETSAETVERAWRSASRMLRKLMNGEAPGS